MSNQDPNEFLNGGGIPSAKFEVGTLWKGPILELDVVQQRDFMTQQLKTWPDGNPMMQLVVTIQTEVRDPAVEDDDGRRRIFVGGKRIREAVAAAVKASRAKIAVGGMIAVKCTGEEPNENPKLSPAKLYVAEYQPPSPESAANNLLGTDSPAPAPASTPAPATNGAPAPVTAGSTGLL